MFLSPEEQEFCVELGLRLRRARIKQRQTQAELAARCGISRQKIIEMEKGDTAASLGRWLKVSTVLGLFDTWKEVLALPVDPFEEYDRKQRETAQLKKTRVRHRK